MDRTQDTLFCKKVPVTLKAALGLSASYPAQNSSINGQPSPATPFPSNLPSHIGGLSGLQIHTSTASPLANTVSDGSHFQEKKHSGITINVSMAAKAGGRFKTLEVQLTDETDPYFLYHLDIAEDDFHSLRTQQNLLVDFSQFPIKFIELLEECIAGALDEHPKFLAHLVADSNAKFATFNVVETNSFKHINHLSLQFIPGTDTAIKQYLASLVTEFKAENIALRNKLSDTDDTLTMRVHEAQATILRLTNELDQIKISHSNLSSQLKLEHSADMSKEREQSARERESIRIQNENERRDLERKHEFELSSISQKLALSTTAHSDLLKHTQSLESTLLTANKDNNTLAYENKSISQELDRVSASLQQSLNRCADLDGALKAANERIENLEHKKRDTDDINRKQQDQLSLLHDQKAKLEESLDVYKTQNVRFEEGMKKSRDEITKGNEIIRKLQTELKATKTKLKLKNVVTLQQEQLVTERGNTIESFQKEIASTKEMLSKKNEETSTLREKIEDLTKKIEEGKAIIVDNNHVIEWLHKQLNDDALNRPLTTTLANGGMATGVDFDKYTNATAADNAKLRSPTATYRSRYLPQDHRTVSPVGQTYQHQTQSQIPSQFTAYQPAARTTTSPSPVGHIPGYSANTNSTAIGRTSLQTSYTQRTSAGASTSVGAGKLLSQNNPTTVSKIATTSFNSGAANAFTSLDTRQGGGKPLTASHTTPSSYF
ncbi:hypothetical protein BATDEDRAFT_90789 [Batrachochytrium dendrobatidis JAM81]|uniref:Spindle assembly abnormal protein 6 N-terminal domain-containing protein n=2 Tax=Batrachochytrium dendrobatidis TaxID=109871 RepID=F4P982_BATDJ|nr:uncharacterized protein BATDEDRAFT_90789 [Batrachochytrium dendrobatidis JAM81]EGF78297.1 hypothetical protein BATDEDRAFT_90789 [Batrachochytrium dendrobatidis JAM81]OAJ44381.1 hypothetical protein BDEG_27615 [Batrachochytrium dendrobatidis JEL423]|eukprot:XP_006681270.1 hypothetical protein BATDEDRAFT_90789 [Batrachochytrium dendrobatidis JAM81]